MFPPNACPLGKKLIFLTSVLSALQIRAAVFCLFVVVVVLLLFFLSMLYRTACDIKSMAKFLYLFRFSFRTV